MELEIIYQDKYLVAINKPHGLLVHRSSIAADVNVFALQLLRDQLGRHVYPIHRLDRKTAGVLLFALNPEVVPVLQEQFNTHTIYKEYWAITRGWFPDKVDLDYPLKNERGNEQSAVTLFKNLEHVEINFPFGKHSTSRYSLIQAFPKTGRTHQIRKHLAHLRHPIIADRPHGCNKQNKLFKDKWDVTTMMLVAKRLKLKHPITHAKFKIEAELSQEFIKVLKLIGVTKFGK